MSSMRATFLILVSSLLLALSAHGETPAFSLQRLQDISKDIVTIRIGFTQTKRLAMLDEPVISPGSVEINRKLGAVRWQYTGKSTLILYRDRLRRFDADGKEETIGDRDPSRQAAQGQMRAFLTGDWSALEDLFTITADAGGKPILHLTAKSPDIGKFIAGITLTFRDDLSAPAGMTMISATGDSTEYIFKEPEIGIDLPAARFEAP